MFSILAKSKEKVEVTRKSLSCAEMENDLSFQILKTKHLCLQMTLLLRFHRLLLPAGQSGQSEVSLSITASAATTSDKEGPLVYILFGFKMSTFPNF